MAINHENQISAFIHCSRCMEEIPDGVTPMEWSRTQTGFTPNGLQVWCNRHDINVCNIDFEGHAHPAITYAEKP